MKIRELLPPYLYSMQYGDDDKQDEYERLLDVWTDADAVASFFESHSQEMDPLFWGDIAEPEVAASRTITEAYDLDEHITTLYHNAKLGVKPDYDDYFQPLNGEFGYLYIRTPMKAYGPGDPSLLRLYAIKLSSNCYLITGGGIKYCKTMQESPELMAEIDKLKSVLSFLKHLGIEDAEDVTNYVRNGC